MLPASNPARVATHADMNLMTFRVYLRWPRQRVTDKTSTESRVVAEAAYSDLLKQAETFAAKGALGISLTEDGRQLQYHKLADEADGKSR
jgi:hypothetical protein